MPSRRMIRKRKVTVPARKAAEKLAIWSMYREPVGFKFYGKYVPEGEKEWKHFEFSVIASARMRRKAMRFWVKKVYERIKFKKLLPRKHYYDSYPSFMNLVGDEWIDVERAEVDVKHTAT